MSVNRDKSALPTSSLKIRKARIFLKPMTKWKPIERMVKAGALTEDQAERARKKLAEVTR